MNCQTCNVSNICRIREFINSNSHIADITINNCIYKNNIQAISTQSVEMPRSNPINTTKIIRDFTEASRAASKDPVSSDFKSIKISDLGEHDLSGTLLINCPTCGGKTVQDDLKTCDECGTVICSNCGTFDGETKKLYCEKCWKELK